MPLLAPTLVFLLVAIPPAEDVPALLRARAQQLVDAITRGDASVWEQALDAGARIIDESGEVMDRKAMVDSVRPLPPGISGALRVVDFQATVLGDIALTTYIADEDETFHGAKIHARYRMGETWARRDGKWKMLSMQVLALRSDPPALPTTAEQRRVYCGRYSLGDLTYVVRCETDGLTGGTQGKPAKPLRLESPDVFFIPGEPRLRYLFQRDAAGRVTGFLQRRESWDLPWKRVD
ncbi:MAG TPA: nuclear transport factor 2 family protein [Myxococcaceae bacterium]|nr:nuclear transport factor 2 family protein [Myxococcaceae bacterium]